MFISQCKKNEVGKMRVRRRDTRIWFLSLGIFAAVFLFTFLSHSFKKMDEKVEAANLSNFDPGYIISDFQMGNYTSMTEAEIQAFLTMKNPCDNTDYDLYLRLSRNAGYTWHFANGHFVCLSEEKFGDGEVIGSGDTAAHILWQAAQDYKINPQALIVLLQKETGLITDRIPNNGDYRKATGYGCPDTAPCSAQYYGFKNQVRRAAALFRTVLDGGWTNYPLGENYVQYNPNAACGGSVVNIRSLATSALYRYTPYQPNAGALAAGYGTAYCGAYGNRNFYHYFEDWFGGITDEKLNSEWQAMANPRMMEVTVETMAINPKEETIYEDAEIKIGGRYHFTSKIDIIWGGKREVCLRTAEDTNNNIDKCIIMSRMADINGPLYSVESIETKYFALVKDTNKINLKTQKVVQALKASDYVKIAMAEKADYAGKTYYRTLYDVKNNNENYIQADDLTDIIYDNFMYPRNMMVTEDTSFVDLLNPEDETTTTTTNSTETDDDETATDVITVCKAVKSGYVARFETKIEYNNKLYFRTDIETKAGTNCVIDASLVKDSLVWLGGKVEFKNFMLPRNMKVKEDLYSVNVNNGTSCDYYKKDEVLMFSTKVDLKGGAFFRTEKDTSANLQCAIPNNKLSEI